MNGAADPDDGNAQQRARRRGPGSLAADLRKGWALGPRGWVDLSRAVVELASANMTVRRVDTSRLGLIDDIPGENSFAPLPDQERLVERIAFAIGAMAARVPWRSDCLVQAVAARRWLASGGVPSRIAIGVRHGDDGEFLAHAWLTVGERVVTGGDTEPFEEFERTSHTRP